MEINLRKASPDEINSIWEILQFAILKRKKEGSTQWQDGYPNPKVIEDDLTKNQAYVMTINDQIALYCCIQKHLEPTYENIEGKWNADLPYWTIHRLAIAPSYQGQGWTSKTLKIIEKEAIDNNIQYIRIDTMHDNAAMLHVLKKLNYNHCGIIQVRDGERLAFDKLIK